MTKPPAMPELPEKIIFSERLAISEAAQVPMDAECCRVIQATLDYIRSNYALAALQSAQPAAVSDAEIDVHLDLILRAAGSALRHYTLPKSIDDLRAALRSAILALRPALADTPEPAIDDADLLGIIAGIRDTVHRLAPGLAEVELLQAVGGPSEVPAYVEAVVKALTATTEPVGEPVAFAHWPLNGPPRLVWHSNKALEDAIVRSRQGHVPDMLLYAAHPAQAVPMTDDQVWHSDGIMSANGIAGFKLDALMRIVRAVEAHHGIIAQAKGGE